MFDLIAKIVVVGTLVAGVTAVVGASGASAAPLPPGGYAAEVDGGIVSLWVDPSGEVVVSGDHDRTDVLLTFDDDGNVLDRFEVATEGGLWSVEIDTSREQVYLVTVTAPDDGETTTERDADQDDGSSMADRVNGVADVIQDGVEGVQSTAEGVMDRVRGSVSADDGPGRSEDATSREDGASPGNSGASTSRTGTPPGQSDNNGDGPGNSDDATSRQDGASPGNSGDAASRRGTDETPPEPADDAAAGADDAKNDNGRGNGASDR